MTELWHELNLLGRIVAVFLACIIVSVAGLLIYVFIPAAQVSFGNEADAVHAASALDAAQGTTSISHVDTPQSVKAIYMTSCIASGVKLRTKVLDTLKGTQINAIVLDLKDYTGTLSYEGTNVEGPKGSGCRIVDLPRFISELHALGYYVIGRVTVFQDPLYAQYAPDMAVQSVSHPGHPWKDKHGLSYMDPDFPAYWRYIAAIAEESHSIGVDEVNFDYIRFPSDGDMSDAQFAIPQGETKAQAITRFFKYLHDTLAPQGIKTSADLFGQTTVNRDDMGIGQVLEDALPYFDYVAPMDYPSHFVSGFMGFANPADKPYEIIQGTMTSAVERTAAASTSLDKLRPWLQAFDLGATYTPDMVQAQMKAVYDTGLTSWMLWDPANAYTKAEL